MSSDQITVVGGGLAGLTAAITAAEAGANVRLLEAHEELGGRARSTASPYKANLGPHALLCNSPFWAWLGERDLLPPAANPRLCGFRFRWHDEIRRVPAVGAAVARSGCAGARRRSSWTSGPGRQSRSGSRRPTRSRAAPGSSPTTTTRGRCRPRSYGSRSSARYSRRRRRPAIRSAAGHDRRARCSDRARGSASRSRPARAWSSCPSRR